MDTYTIVNTINQITKLIVSEAHPEAVYLYGSQANGSATEYSDIDILVLKAGTHNLIDRDLDVKANALTNKLVDIKIIDPQQVDVYPAYKSACMNGKRLY